MFENGTELPEPEEAQRAFADLYDGDYLMSDLLSRSPELMHAVMKLWNEIGEQSPPRTTTFRNEDGTATQITRPPERLRHSKVQADETMVIVRSRRVEGFTKA